MNKSLQTIRKMNWLALIEFLVFVYAMWLAEFCRHVVGMWRIVCGIWFGGLSIGLIFFYFVGGGERGCL